MAKHNPTFHADQLKLAGEFRVVQQQQRRRDSIEGFVMSEFESTVCGIPCIIRVTYYEHYRPAFVSGPPENCYPAEGGCGDWEVLDRRGRPAAWLERKLTDRERSRIDEEVFEHMEASCDDY